MADCPDCPEGKRLITGDVVFITRYVPGQAGPTNRGHCVPHAKKRLGPPIQQRLRAAIVLFNTFKNVVPGLKELGDVIEQPTGADGKPGQPRLSGWFRGVQLGYQRGQLYPTISSGTNLVAEEQYQIGRALLQAAGRLFDVARPHAQQKVGEQLDYVRDQSGVCEQNQAIVQEHRLRQERIPAQPRGQFLASAREVFYGATRVVMDLSGDFKTPERAILIEEETDRELVRILIGLDLDSVKVDEETDQIVIDEETVRHLIQQTTGKLEQTGVVKVDDSQIQQALDALRSEALSLIGEAQQQLEVCRQPGFDPDQRGDLLVDAKVKATIAAAKAKAYEQHQPEVDEAAIRAQVLGETGEGAAAAEVSDSQPDRNELMDNNTFDQLREMAEGMGLTVSSKMRKGELATAITEKRDQTKTPVKV